jgi:hypothetical protein
VQLGCELAGEILASRNGTPPVADDGGRAIRARVSAEEVKLVADDRGQRADRRPTAPS